MEYKFDNLPPVLQNAFLNQTILTETGEIRRLSSNISCREALRLYTLVRKLRPEVTIEIGLAEGMSTLAILQALEDNQCGTHHVIDPYQSQYWHNAGLQMIEAAKLTRRMCFYESFPEETIPNLPMLQFGFIDSSHLFDLTLLDFVLVDKKLVISGIIGMHDLWMPSLQAVYRYIVSNRAYKPYPDINQRERIKGFAKSMLVKLLPLAASSKRRSCVEVIHPRSPFTLDMVFIQKTDHDERNWRFHRSF